MIENKSLHLFDLPMPLLYNIYDFLDVDSVKNLSDTSYDARYIVDKISKHDSLFKKVESFIIENYRIVDCSMKSDIKKLYFYHTHLIVLGETHCREDHRLLNSTLINLIWKTRYRLMIEYWKEGVVIGKKEKIGVFKDLNDKAVKKAETWKCDGCTEDTGADEFFEATKIFVLIIKDYFILFSDENTFTFEKLSLFLENRFEESYISEIYQKIPQIEDFKDKETQLNESEKAKTKKIINEKLNDFILEKLLTKSQRYLKDFDALIKHCDHDLVMKIVKTVFSLGKSSIFISGSLHVESQYVISQTRRFHKIRPIPFIFLTPKESISKQSILKNYEKLFNASFSHKNSKVEPLSTSLSDKNSEVKTLSEIGKRHLEMEKLSNILKNLTEENIELILKEVKEKIDLQYLTTIFLNCDVEEIDMDQNHFSSWFTLCWGLLYLEKARLQKSRLQQ